MKTSYAGQRWVVLLAGIVMQTILGGIYAWSTVTPWLYDSYGIGSAQSGFIFGMTIAIFTLVMLFSGQVLVKRGPRITAMIGALFYLSGYVFASFAHGSFLLLLVGIGLLSGSGMAFGYVVPLSVGMKWFPTRKGLVTGLSVGGFGGGAILLSYIVEHARISSVDLAIFFRWYGFLASALLLISALLMDVPQQEHQIRSQAFPSSIRMGPLWLSIFGMFCGTFAGLLIVGNLFSYATHAGFTVNQAVSIVMIFSVGNSLGRIVWGYVYDRIDIQAIILAFSLFGIACVLLLLPSSLFILFFAVLLAGFSFGGNFVLFAGVISKIYGVARFPQLYPLCFLSYGFAGSIAPAIGGYFAETFGSYDAALVICIVIISLAGGTISIQRKQLMMQPKAECESFASP